MLINKQNLLNELKALAQWIRCGHYNQDDILDEIARAVENRVRFWEKQ